VSVLELFQWSLTVGLRYQTSCHYKKQHYEEHEKWVESARELVNRIYQKYCVLASRKK
jgi:hypothetical protein